MSIIAVPCHDCGNTDGARLSIAFFHAKYDEISQMTQSRCAAPVRAIYSGQLVSSPLNIVEHGINASPTNSSEKTKIKIIVE